MHYVTRSTIASSSQRLHYWIRRSSTIHCQTRSHHVLADISTKTTTQTYISSSFDPYINLSIEQYLLTNCHPSSSVLFLYINSPCVVIGRNQNPWNEVNLSALRTRPAISNLRVLRERQAHSTAPAYENVQLVRRRSGGGTVFHDAGNLNYCVITPRTIFDRDRSAMMVSRSLERLPGENFAFGGRNIRVNERHDIVMDLPEARDTAGSSADLSSTVKISGSAYKLTSGRALHHGTLLLSSPNLQSIGSYLRSPARDHIKAKGVDSVRSPIGNVFGPTVEDPSSAIEMVKRAITAEFLAMTDPRHPPLGDAIEAERETVLLGDEVLSGDDLVSGKIGAGVAELQSLDWKFLQTPTFTIFPPGLPPESAIEVKRGLLSDGTPLHRVDDFSPYMPGNAGPADVETMSDLFPCIGAEKGDSG